jgi:hypothetical protein
LFAWSLSATKVPGVLVSRFRVAGLLVPLLATVACTGGEPEPAVRRSDVALQSYAAPGGAPAYCALLAESLHLTGVAGSVGMLTVRPGDVEARLQLAAAADELTAVRDEVSPDGRLTHAIDGLVEALTEARSGSLTDSVRADISAGLDDVGRLAQPDCDFPA